MSAVQDATLKELVAEVDRRGQIEVLKAEIATMPTDQQAVVTDVIQDLARRNRLEGFIEQPGCVHEDECRAEWIKPGYKSARHHWAGQTLDLDQLRVTLTPSLAVEANEPVRQEHIELDITVENRTSIEGPVGWPVQVEDVQRLIGALQSAVSALPEVRTT